MKIITIHQDDCPMDPHEGDGQWRLYSFGRRHVHYESPSRFFDDNRRPRLWLRNKLRAGTAFILSYFEHGNCVWSLRGTGPQCQWDNVDVAGVLVWEHPVGDMGAKTVEARAKDAAAFLETYTCWCNGDVYGYTVEEVVTLPCGHTETNHVDSCFGYYGNDLDFMKEEIVTALGGDTDVTIKSDASGHFDADDFRPTV